MFGIKIISEKKYLREKVSSSIMLKHNEELAKKIAQLEADIKNLRVQNSKLRSVNEKRLDENARLAVQNAKHKEIIKEHEAFRHSLKLALPEVDFKGYYPSPCIEKCSDCKFESTGCKKYTNLSLCMLEKPSFQGEDK